MKKKNSNHKKFAETVEEVTPQPAKVSKNQILLELLKEGATIKTLMEATNWQKHSVHGAISNLKKKHGFSLANETTEAGEKLYRIA